MTIEKKIGKVWLLFGWNFKRFGLGFEFDRHDAMINLAFFYFCIEYWGLWYDKDRD